MTDQHLLGRFGYPLIFTALLIGISACSPNTSPDTSNVDIEPGTETANDYWSNEAEVVFQEAAALRHTLDELKQQEQWQEEMDQPANSNR